MKQHTHVRLWRYHVPAEQEAAFIHHYHADGSWAKLFRRADGYLGTQLWRDENDPRIFYTADHWRDRDAFLAFQRDFRSHYQRMDAEFGALTSDETFLGAGDGVGSTENAS